MPIPTSSTSEAKLMDASDPVDAPPSGLSKPPQPAKEAQQDDDFPIQLPDGLSEDALLKWSMKRKKEHERWFGDNNGYNERITNAWKAYNGKLLAGQTNPAAVPVSNSIVEVDTAKSYTSLFSKAKAVDAQPRSPQVDNENKTTIEDLVNQELLFGMSETGTKAFSFLKALKIEGTAFFRAKWEKRSIETINVPVALDPIGGGMVATQTIAKSKVFKDVHGPDFDAVPVQNSVWDHRVENKAQESEYFCHRQFPTLTDLLIMQDAGKIVNVDAIQKLAQSQKTEQMNPDQKRKQQLAPQGNGPAEGPTEDPSKRLDEWFGWVPYQCPQEDGTTKWEKVSLHWMIVNDEVLVMCEPNPWIDEEGHGPNHPFISVRQTIEPRELLGASVLKPVMELQTYVNNTHASVKILTNKAAKSPTFVSRASGLDTLRLFQDELSIIPVMDPSKVVHHPVDGGQIKAVGEERAWGINMMRETVAANEQAQGVSSPTLSDATATEASIINANSGTRFQFVVDQIAHEFFAGMANLYWWMIRQWAKDGDLVVRESTIDGAPRPITRAHLVDDYFFVPITSAVLNDQRAQLQTKMAFGQQMAQLQGTNPAAMTDEDGNQYHFDLITFIRQEIMPMMGVRNGFTYFQKLPPAPPPILGPDGQPVSPALQGGPQAAPPGLPQHPGIPTPPVRGPIPPAALPPHVPTPSLPTAPQPGFTQPFRT